MANLGYVGLGAMGGRMAGRLLSKGHSVTGYNRTRSKAQWLIDRGMQWADSPRALAEVVDVVFVMVANSAALEAVALGPDGILAGMGPGKLLIDMSTVGPDVSRSIAAGARARGGDMVDAPVSGSVITLEQGKLSIMVGGEPATFDRVKPLLEDIGPKVTHVGGNGLAVTMKIAVNLSLAVQMLAFSEGVLLAEKSGIARKTAVEVLTNSVVASPMVIYRGPFVLQMSAADRSRRAWPRRRTITAPRTCAWPTGRFRILRRCRARDRRGGLAGWVQSMIWTGYSIASKSDH